MVSEAPSGKLLVQLVPHEIEPPVTMPVPTPTLATVNEKRGEMSFGVNVAVTVVSAFSGTRQGAVPPHPPPFQPVKSESGEAMASRTAVVCLKLAAHVGPQSMPAGTEMTLPDPSPSLRTTRVGEPFPMALSAPAAITP